MVMTTAVVVGGGGGGGGDGDGDGDGGGGGGGCVPVVVIVLVLAVMTALRWTAGRMEKKRKCFLRATTHPRMRRRLMCGRPLILCPSPLRCMPPEHGEEVDEAGVMMQERTVVWPSQRTGGVYNSRQTQSSSI